MRHAFLWSLGSATAVSLLSLISLITLPLRGRRLNQIIFALISLATGALFGDAILHLLPEIFKNNLRPLVSSLWILAGILASFVLEKFLRWKHEHGLGHDHGHGAVIKPVGRIILVSDGLHNLMDGILIGASYLTSVDVGIATSLAVILHELPHELGDFAVLVDSGYSWEKALLFNFLSACAAIAGVLTAFVFQAGVQHFTEAAVPITAGTFLYIAGSNLTPELQKESSPIKSLIQFAAMIAGVGLMLLLFLFE